MQTAPATTAYQQLQQWDSQVAIMQESNQPFFLFGTSGQVPDDIGQERPSASGSIDVYA
jgi:hypothetical protein